MPDMDVSDLVGSLLRDVPDFPSPGILFKDITPLLADGAAFGEVTRAFADLYRGQVDVVAGVEARGFIVGAALAHELGLGFVPVRKSGKLPGETTSVTYDLEYGSATIEVHTDAFTPGQRVVVLDDVLATGGTAVAACELVERAGAAVVALGVIVELAFLNGRDSLPARRVDALHVVAN